MVDLTYYHKFAKVIWLIGWVLHIYSVGELVDLESFLVTKNLTLSDRLQEAWMKTKKVWVFFSVIGLPQREF